jgi:hypothetical protein
MSLQPLAPVDLTVAKHPLFANPNTHPLANSRAPPPNGLTKLAPHPSPEPGLADELTDLVAPTLSTLVFPPGGLFLRLDACSPKDGERGTKPLRTIDEILLRLTTSYRVNDITGLLDRNATCIQLFFLPYNGRMSTDLEYRVFCTPPEARVAAVSQYRWHQPSVFRGRSEDELEGIVQRIWGEIQRIHREILVEAMAGKGGEMDELLLKQGFSFDVSYDEKMGRCCLIELNSFGARSGCGSCLFHWLRDGDVLYGRTVKRDEVGSEELADVEFRISA